MSREGRKRSKCLQSGCRVRPPRGTEEDTDKGMGSVRKGTVRERIDLDGITDVESSGFRRVT